MEPFEFVPADKSIFLGRDAELGWLDTHILPTRRYGTVLGIVGVGGIGKTALVRHWLSSRQLAAVPLWVDIPRANPYSAISKLRTYFLEQRRRNEFIVVLDGVESLSEEEYQGEIDGIFNFKAVRSVIFTSRSRPPDPRFATLSLGQLAPAAAAELFKALSPTGLTPELMAGVTEVVCGYPLAICFLAQLLQAGNVDSLREILQGRIYDLSGAIAVPSTEIMTAAAPRIMTAHDAVIDALKKQPTQIHSLSARQFEELLAHLLADMGWEVELTKATRDGGKDILAYLNTDLGRLLCLVEAKHYRQDRKVGVELVRTLYGTLCDANANSAMLVTSSSFSSDAREFQQRHSYQLALRDYADIVSWITKYGKTRK